MLRLAEPSAPAGPAAAGAARTWRHAHVWGACAAALACLALRMSNLLALPVYSDESMYVRSGQFVALGPSQVLFQLRHGSPPMFSWLEAPLMSLHVWSPVLAGRVTVALLGVCTCVLLMACAAQLGGGRLVPLVGWAYALCPYAVFNDRMAMLDGPVATWAALALLFGLRLSHRAEPSPSLPNLVGLGLAIGAGLLTKFFAASFELVPLLLAVQAPCRAARLRLFLVPGAISLAALLPVLFAPAGSNLVSQLPNHASGHMVLLTVARQYAALGAWAVVYLTVPGFLLFLVGLGLAARRGRNWRLVELFLLLAAIAFASIPATFVASRWLYFLTVPAVLLIGLGADYVLTRARSLPAWHVAALLLVAVLPAMTQDGLLVASPAQAVLVPFDRWQYVEGWPSGFGFSQAVDWIRRAARNGPVVVICAPVNPPGDALFEELESNRNVAIVPMDIGSRRAAAVLVSRYRRAVIVTDEENGEHVLGAALQAHVRVAARFWKPGHRTAYVIYEVRG